MFKSCRPDFWPESFLLRILAFFVTFLPISDSGICSESKLARLPELTANDSVCTRPPESGGNNGGNFFAPSPSVPVACKLSGLRCVAPVEVSAGSDSTAPWTSSNRGSV